MNFAIIGVAGYIAPRHLKAIRDTGNVLVAATDPHDSVGVLDQYSTHVRYFREIERFDRHLDKLRRGSRASRVDYVSICSPNYLHDAHIRLAMRNDADVLCEKPLVISPWNLEALQRLEVETGRRVYTVLQLRVHPAILALKDRLDQSSQMHDVELMYITSRGGWYHVSWKGSEEHSGGIAMNIGIHLFDLLLFLFGPCQKIQVFERTNVRVSGSLEMARARVQWILSVDASDLPPQCVTRGHRSIRSLKIDGEETNFTDGFEDLHTLVYERTIRGDGFGIDVARPSIEVVYAIRTMPLAGRPASALHSGRRPLHSATASNAS